MPSPVTYDFEPNDVVWHITDDAGIRKATVTHVTILESSSETITYHLLYSDDLSVAGATENVYAEADIDTALADYKTMLLA